MEQFAEQGREIAGDSVLRWGEWLGAEPYATRRIADMRRFAQTQNYQTLEEWFLREAHEPPPALPTPGRVSVSRADCAGWWRRFTATLIDLVVVTSLVTAISGTDESATRVVNVTNVDNHGKTTHSATVVPGNTADTAAADLGSTKFGWISFGLGGIHVAEGTPLAAVANVVGRDVAFWAAGLYFALLVGLAGQTFGMMITGLRVVTTDFRKPGLGLAFWRYVLGFALFFIIFPLSLIQHRVMLHDRWSRTRLITSERAMARAATASAAAVAASAPA